MDIKVVMGIDRITYAIRRLGPHSPEGRSTFNAGTELEVIRQGQSVTDPIEVK